MTYIRRLLLRSVIEDSLMRLRHAEVFRAQLEQRGKRTPCSISPLERRRVFPQMDFTAYVGPRCQCSQVRGANKRRRQAIPCTDACALLLDSGRDQRPWREATSSAHEGVPGMILVTVRYHITPQVSAPAFITDSRRHFDSLQAAGLASPNHCAGSARQRCPPAGYSTASHRPVGVGGVRSAPGCRVRRSVTVLLT